MTIFVESETFKQMISYKPYVTDKHAKKQVKYSLLDRIKEGLGDKWYRLKEGTRQAFEQICFFSTELGFFYASDDYLSEYNNVSKRTIQYRLKEQVELGQVIKVNRRSSRSNGKGKVVYLFANHPYFDYWMELLGINCGTNCDTENVETSCESKDEQPKKVSTYVITEKQESNITYSENKIVKYVVNRVMDSVKQGTKITYLSSYIDRIVRSLEKQALYAENMRLEKAKRLQRERLAIEVGMAKKQLRLEDVYYNYYE